MTLFHRLQYLFIVAGLTLVLGCPASPDREEVPGEVPSAENERPEAEPHTTLPQMAVETTVEVVGELDAESLPGTHAEPAPVPEVDEPAPLVSDLLDEPSASSPLALESDAMVGTGLKPISQPPAGAPTIEATEPRRFEGVDNTTTLGLPTPRPITTEPDHRADVPLVAPAGMRRNPLRDPVPVDTPINAPVDAPSNVPSDNVAPSPEVDSSGLPTSSNDSSPPPEVGVKSSKEGKGAKGETFDPIKVNGPVFVDWPKPKLALVITGRQDGYIEPCGCAGLDRMKGGMTRRHTFIDSLREWGWPVVAMDAGGIARGFGRQAELKFQIMVDGMRKMGYDAITLGKSDLRLPAAELLSVTASTDQQQSPFFSTNAAPFGFDAGMTASSRVIEAAGMKIGIAGVLGTKWQQEVNNSEVEMVDPEEALRRVLPELQKEADLLILLCHATLEETRALAEKFPEFAVVVTAGGAPEPPPQPDLLHDGKGLLIEVGEKGMDAIVLGLYDGAQQPWRYQRVPLDSRYTASPDMQMLMRAYQDQIKYLGFSGLGIRPVPHPQQEVNGKFVGSKKCETCHEESFKIWKKSGHAKAYETLVELDPPRNFDPECVSCHVIGWHPTKYFPYEGGYQSLADTPHLIDVGCESCHGPGGAHVAAEAGSDLALQEKLQKALVVTKEESEKRQCLTCHDLDNSPDFDFKTYWPKVEHYEDE